MNTKVIKREVGFFLLVMSFAFLCIAPLAHADILSTTANSSLPTSAAAAVVTQNAVDASTIDTFVQFQKDFDTYFQGDDRTRILNEFEKYIDTKLVGDGYKPATVSSSVKAAYYQKYAAEFVQYAAANNIIAIGPPQTTQHNEFPCNTRGSPITRAHYEV